MLKRLERRAASVAPPDTLVLLAPAEDLPFEDDAFDTVVSTPEGTVCFVDTAGIVGAPVVPVSSSWLRFFPPLALEATSR